MPTGHSLRSSQAEARASATALRFELPLGLQGADGYRRRPRLRAGFGLALLVATLGGAIAFTANRYARSDVLSASANTELVDQRLQRVATLALGDRRGAIIVMDPQTGRIRALVNSEVAFAESLPPGSTIKPFTALAALRSGVIADDTRTLCGETYAHEKFHTTCSHPRDLPPLNPTDALAYSCNYYFGKLGERLAETDFNRTLSEFGFGKPSGINAAEAPGLLRRNEWHSQDAIGAGDYLRATPIQLLDAYAALVNGGHLFVPRVAPADGFVRRLRADVVINAQERITILKGMRGAIRYGTAETARLYSLPIQVFGKTGTATEINGYRSQGWFIGFASPADGTAPDEAEFAPGRVKLAVLVFLARAHGSDAAETARPIFADYAQTEGNGEAERLADARADQSSYSISRSQRRSASTSLVKVHLVHENVTRTLSLEDYVLGVVAAEGSLEREPEALKALAIASRTYAIRNLGRHHRDGYDFCSTTHCERYRAPLSSGEPSSAIVEAVAATRDEVLREGNSALADSYFSASCGGATANLATLWGGVAPPYLRGSRDDYCASEAHHSWTDVISQAQLLKALQTDPRTNIGNRLDHVSVLRTDASGRAELISINGERHLTVSGWDFKIIVGRALGWQLLKSSRFAISRSGANYVFRGSGFGHGLGLCQEGAHVMAARGAGYRQILAKYFPTTHVAGGSAADLMWSRHSSQQPDRQGGLLSIEPGFEWEGALPHGRASAWSLQRSGASPKTLSSENFRVNFPPTIDQREVAGLLGLLESSRRSLIARAAAAGVTAQFPALEIFLNETTGDFVGRTGQPPWAAAATKGKRIELQPLATLKRRRILETTVRHELVHTLVNVISRERAPRWLTEGLALYVAGEGPMLARYQPRRRPSTDEIEKQLADGNSASSSDEMRAAYAAAYGEVKRLIDGEGEANVWRRLAR